MEEREEPIRQDLVGKEIYSKKQREDDEEFYTLH